MTDSVGHTQLMKLYNAFMCVLCSIYALLCSHHNIRTPHEVMFGQKAVLPVDYNSQESYDPEEALKAFDEAPLPDPADIEAHRNEMNVMVKENIEKAQAKQKEQYDRKHTLAGSFAVGALVLKKDFTQKHRGGGALDYRWLGPYTITCSLGKGLYHLADV